MKNFFIIFLMICAIDYGYGEDNAGLYSDDDNVVILTGKNFKENVFDSPYVWLVEFYSAWCGHCQHFAPTFKSLAKNVKEWQGLVKLAVINCPIDENKDICRELDVNGYPALRFFQPYSNSSNKGKELEGRTTSTMQKEILNTVEEYEDQFKFTDEISRLNFQPITFEEFNKIAYGNHSKYYRAFVFENDSSTMGKEIILDVTPCSNITVRRVDPSTEYGKRIADQLKVDVEKLPNVAVVAANKVVTMIKVDIKVRSFYTHELEKLPGILKEENDNGKHVTETTVETDVVPWQSIDRSKVYMADIESSIHYSFMNEITSFKTIEGEQLASLKEYLLVMSLLANHLPVSKSTANFLVRVQQWTEDKRIITYEQLDQEIKIKNVDDYLPTTNQRWVGCVGSEPNKRGYPCSLWTLFHSMTVAAYNANLKDVSLVPKAIFAYITNFFGCKTCTENFKKEIEKLPFPVGASFSSQDTVMWLWSLHNSVNKRLHGDISEDKQFEKVQFPPKDFCLECSSYSFGNVEWNNEYVFKFLVHRYSKEHVSYQFLDGVPQDPPTREDKKEEEQNPSFEEGGGMQVNAMFEEDYDNGPMMAYDHMAKAIDGDKNHILHNELNENRAKDVPQDPHEFVQQMEVGFHPRNLQYQNKYSRWLPMGFSALDRNICIMIWLLSMVCVVIVYLFIRIKRQYRPKKFRVH